MKIKLNSLEIMVRITAHLYFSENSLVKSLLLHKTGGTVVITNTTKYC